MKSPCPRMFVLAVGIIVIILSAGCEEGHLQDEQKARAIAAENMQLRSRIQQLDAEIKKQKKQFENKLKKQEELLAKCRDENAVLQQRLSEEYAERLDEFIETIAAEYVRVQQENEKLKQQIEQLKAELEGAKKPTEQSADPL